MPTQDEQIAAEVGAAGVQNEDAGMSTDENLHPPQLATAAGLNHVDGHDSAEAMTVQQLMVYCTPRTRSYRI